MPAEILGEITRSPLIIHNAASISCFWPTSFGFYPAQVFCTQTASRLLSGSRTIKHDLGAVLERYLGVKLTKEYGASDWGTTSCHPNRSNMRKMTFAIFTRRKRSWKQNFGKPELCRKCSRWKWICCLSSSRWSFTASRSMPRH